MSISTIVTRGFGAWGSIKDVVLRGFGIGELPPYEGMIFFVFGAATQPALTSTAMTQTQLTGIQSAQPGMSTISISRAGLTNIILSD